VLKFKHEVELALMASGLPYTLLRPSRLTDGPYTSFDLNTLLQVGGSCFGIARPGQCSTDVGACKKHACPALAAVLR
jgi:uncharacterized protein YbjT (DUF2867 family)